MSHMTIVTCVMFSCAVVFVLCVYKKSFLVVSGEVVKAMVSKSVDTR